MNEEPHVVPENDRNADAAVPEPVQPNEPDPHQPDIPPLLAGRRGNRILLGDPWLGDSDSDDDGPFPPAPPIFAGPRLPWLQPPLDPLLMMARAHRPSRSLFGRDPTYPCDESVEFVRSKIREATEKGMLLNYLFSHVPETPLFQTKGTPLHVACLDHDGKRGEGKIGLLFQAATEAGLSLELLASARSEDVRLGGNHGGHTPLHRLLTNSSSTTRSMEIVCNAWPGAIFATTHTYGSTPLCDAFFGCLLRTLDGFQAKLDIMLNIARQTPDGVEALITHRGHERSTALHDAVYSPRWSAPENIHHRDAIFAQLLQACPSAIHIIDDEGRNPLHRCLFEASRQEMLGANRSLLDLLRVLVTNTTKTCLVAALATEAYTKDNDEEAYGEIPIGQIRANNFSDVEEYFSELARTQDPNGWTLLHYAAANTICVGDRPPRTNQRERSRARHFHRRLFGMPMRRAVRIGRPRGPHEDRAAVEARLDAPGHPAPRLARRLQDRVGRMDPNNEPDAADIPGNVRRDALDREMGLGRPRRARPLDVGPMRAVRRGMNRDELPGQGQHPEREGLERQPALALRVRARDVDVLRRNQVEREQARLNDEGRENEFRVIERQLEGIAGGEFSQMIERQLELMQDLDGRVRQVRARHNAAEEARRAQQEARRVVRERQVDEEVGERREEVRPADIQELNRVQNDFQQRLEQLRQYRAQDRWGMFGPEDDEDFVRGLRRMQALRRVMEAIPLQEVLPAGRLDGQAQDDEQGLGQEVRHQQGMAAAQVDQAQGNEAREGGQEAATVPKQDKRRGTKKLIDWLLEVHPKACSMPDSDGRLPIHLAAESGKEWENGVQSLALAFPSGVSTVDPVSGLYPFMIAATGAMSDLDCIYELLRFAPQHIGVANTGT